MNLLWTLVFVLNGQVVTSEPMVGEACIMAMLNRPVAQQSYCAHPDGRRMRRPETCETIKGWPLWCKPVKETA